MKTIVKIQVIIGIVFLLVAIGFTAYTYFEHMNQFSDWMFSMTNAYGDMHQNSNCTLTCQSAQIASQINDMYITTIFNIYNVIAIMIVLAALSIYIITQGYAKMTKRK